LFEEEPLEEILRERINYYKSINKPIDFWILRNSSLINFPHLINIKKTINQPISAIVSYNLHFINWIKLRVGFVLVGECYGPPISCYDINLNKSNYYRYDNLII
jgi:Protein of unknown function (DUF2488)